MRKESWTERIAEESPRDLVYPAFLRHISPIGIESNHVKGKVLVIGQAGAFPEKTLFTTPESGFREFRTEIEAIYCCDTAYPSSPETHLNAQCTNTVFYDQIPDPSPKTAYFDLNSSYTFLQKVKPDFFDTLLMFRVVDTGTQIKKLGLIESVALHIKYGGYFICSGGKFPPSPPDDFYEPLKLIKSVRLPNYSDGFPFTQNVGVILKKD